jgi:glycine cleavage system regulatory protein
MIHLELDEEETALLQQTLEDCLSDLRVEISDTDSHDYKEMLKSKKVLMIKIQEALIHSKLEPVNG